MEAGKEEEKMKIQNNIFSAADKYCQFKKKYICDW